MRVVERDSRGLEEASCSRRAAVDGRIRRRSQFGEWNDNDTEASRSRSCLNFGDERDEEGEGISAMTRKKPIPSILE